MYPNTCYSQMWDAYYEGDYETAADRAESLRDWVIGGGLIPARIMDRATVISECDRMIRHRALAHT